jgi:hypothetical protein
MVEDLFSEVPRRGLLALTAGSLVGTAGCLGGDDTDTTGQNGTDGDSGGPNSTGGPDGSDPDSTGDGDSEEGGPDAGAGDSTSQVRLQSVSAATGPFPLTRDAPADPLTTTATVANTGDASGTLELTVSLTRAGDADPTATTTTTEQLPADTDQTLTLTGSDDALLGTVVPTLSPGDYTLTVSTPDTTRTATLTLTAPPTAALGGLQLDGQPTATVPQNAPPVTVTATLTNAGGQDGTFSVALQAGTTDTATSTGDDSPLPITATDSQPLAAGSSAQLQFTVPVESFPLATHPVTITATPEDAQTDGQQPPARQDTVETDLTVELPPASVTVETYTQTDSEEHFATGGTLELLDENGDTLATHDLGQSAITNFEEEVSNGEEYTLRTDNVDQGAYPDGETTVQPAGETTVKLVTAYEFNGVDSYNYVGYAYSPNETPENEIQSPTEWVMRGTHAADDDHFAQWDNPASADKKPVDAPLQDFETPLLDRLPGKERFLREQIVIDGEGYGREHRSFGKSWESIDVPRNIAFYPPNPEDSAPSPTQPLTAYTDADPELQQFVGEETRLGKTVHRYDITIEGAYPKAAAFVNPETGYTIRWQAQNTGLGNKDSNGHTMWEFTSLGEIPSLSVSDFDFVDPQPPLSPF